MKGFCLCAMFSRIYWLTLWSILIHWQWLYFKAIFPQRSPMRLTYTAREKKIVVPLVNLVLQTFVLVHNNNCWALIAQYYFHKYSLSALFFQQIITWEQTFYETYTRIAMSADFFQYVISTEILFLYVYICYSVLCALLPPLLLLPSCLLTYLPCLFLLARSFGKLKKNHSQSKLYVLCLYVSMCVSMCVRMSMCVDIFRFLAL